MKKTLLATILAVFALTSVFAQGRDSAERREEIAQIRKDSRKNDSFRKKYRNIGYSSQTVTFGNAAAIGPSKFGFGFTTGRSYVVHKNPVAGMLRFGIDATWFDINYGNWGTTVGDEKR